MSIEVEIEFERECYKCYGAYRSGSEPCTRCGGAGYIATELGEKLLEFLEHHGIRPPTTTKEGE